MANPYGTASTVLKTASPMLSSLPYVGPILSMGAGIAGGLLEQKAAQDQASQAAKTRNEALRLKPEPVNKYFMQKYRADQAAALGGLPGYGLAKGAIEGDIATGLRAAKESGASGAQTLALTSALIGKGNQSLNELSMQDAAFRAGLQKDARQDLEMLGGEANRQQDIRDKWKLYGLQGASALENAATYNKMNALNKIFGSVASTATALGASANQDKKYGALMAMLSGAGKEVGDMTSMGQSSITSTGEGATTTDEATDTGADFDGTQLTAEQAQALTAKLSEMLTDPNADPSEILALRNILKQYSTKG